MKLYSPMKLTLMKTRSEHNSLVFDQTGSSRVRQRKRAYTQYSESDGGHVIVENEEEVKPTNSNISRSVSLSS